jgi:hypothetical protein
MSILCEEYFTILVYCLLNLLILAHLKVYQELEIVFATPQRVFGERNDFSE